jgi:prepilin-type N-terminal cleavage/methylation domain-containing protein
MGFTLVELLIVVTILPLIVGALSLGLISAFSLQSSVASRLGDTSDAQVVAANYQKDIQGAALVTTQSPSTPQCGQGTGTQILGIQTDEVTTGKYAGNYLVGISYVSVNAYNGSKSGFSLVRIFCSYNADGSLISSSTSTLAYDAPTVPGLPAITCVTSDPSCGDPAQEWISTQGIAQVGLLVTEPASTYSYSLSASPEASSSIGTEGTPLPASAGTSCKFATPGAGYYSNQLCFVNFSGLTGNALLASEAPCSNGTCPCVEMSASLGLNFNDDILYFCLHQSSVPGPQTSGYNTSDPQECSGQTTIVQPASFPTYQNAYLGNSGTGFYSGVPGDPALYMSRACGWDSTLTFTGIKVLTPAGVPLANWQLVSADAESTDANEYIQWTTPLGPNLQVLPNSPSSNHGSGIYIACGAGVSGTGGTNQITCTGGSPSSGNTKNGTLMVEALQPSELDVEMQHYEAISFGLLLP